MSLTDFCVVAGIAAPIIALANIVAVGDALGLVHFLRGARRRARRGSVRWEAATRGSVLGLVMYFVSSLNLLAQAAVLLFTLRHFGYGSAVSVTWVLTAVAGGVFVTGLAAIFAGLTRNRALTLQASRPRKPRNASSVS